MTQSASLYYPHDILPAPGVPVTVAPGVHWLRQPLPFVLDHVNLWLLDDGPGRTLVDTGIGLDGVRTSWERMLDDMAASPPIRRVFVTHCHPDHLGLADWLSERLGAPLWMTQGELLLAYAWWWQLPGHNNEAMLGLFRQHGLDEARIADIGARGPGYRTRVPQLPRRYERVLDGDEITIGEHAWRVIVGHGHSPEHASLYCEALRVLISGDMVLPRITTNVSVQASTPDGDPLRLYLDSLARLKPLPEDTLVLPSHGKPFRGLHARIAQLEAHHRNRCDELLAACAEPRSACDLIPVLFRRALDTHQVMFAMGEAIAHLNYLQHERKLRRADADDGVQRYVAEAR